MIDSLEEQTLRDRTSEALPNTSLIICSRNRPQLLAETIQSVLDGTKLPTEIVVIDQSDQQHPGLATLQSECDCTVRYLWSQSVGAASARNAGITAARYDLLAFIDDDMIVAQNWYGALIRALEQAGPCSVVTGQVLPATDQQAGGFVPSTKEDQTPAVYEGRIGEDVLYTGNMALYRSAITTIGLFDQRLGPGTAFPAAEDNDFGFRLLEAGYRILYVPQAVLYHLAWRSDRDYLPLRWGYGVGRGGFYAKHLRWRDRHMLQRMIYDIMTHLLLFLRRVRGDRRRAYGDAVLTFGILFGAIRWLLTQRKAH